MTRLCYKLLVLLHFKLLAWIRVVQDEQVLKQAIKDPGQLNRDHGEVRLYFMQYMWIAAEMGETPEDGFETLDLMDSIESFEPVGDELYDVEFLW